jgi:hypothetical protein
VVALVLAMVSTTHPLKLKLTSVAPLALTPAPVAVPIPFVSRNTSFLYEPFVNLSFSTDNYMDYTDEGCRTEFTPGQIALMQRSIVAFRSDPTK